LIIKAREHGPDYVFSLLTGYRERPAGVDERENMHFNPYFAGNFIGMARLLSDDLVEYDDGTPNTASQAAKDVVTFLAWASEPEHDDRKKMGMKVLFVLGIAFFTTLWTKRFKWNVPKHRVITFHDVTRGPGTHK
jgi:ubiquinol-cytochrome c reductase cytochrome c1 subunit